MRKRCPIALAIAIVLGAEVEVFGFGVAAVSPPPNSQTAGSNGVLLARAQGGGPFGYANDGSGRLTPSGVIPGLSTHAPDTGLVDIDLDSLPDLILPGTSAKGLTTAVDSGGYKVLIMLFDEGAVSRQAQFDDCTLPNLSFIDSNCGDANGSGFVNVTDAVFLISYIFHDGTAPDPLDAGDANCDGLVDISDAVYLIRYIFADGPAPCESYS